MWEDHDRAEHSWERTASLSRFQALRSGAPRLSFPFGNICPMKLPDASRADIDPRKLEDYCLSFDHPRGKHKARVFHSSLGVTSQNAAELEVRIREALETEPCTAGAEDRFGRRRARLFIGGATCD